MMSSHKVIYLELAHVRLIQRGSAQLDFGLL